MKPNRATGILAFIAAAGFCAGCLWFAVHKQLALPDPRTVSLNNLPANFGSTGGGNRSFNVPVNSLVFASDDRTNDIDRYNARLKEQVEHLIATAETGDTKAVLAEERSLPTAALPMLQRATTRPALSAATTRPIGDALAADHFRLGNSLEFEKTMRWYRTRALNLFDGKLNTQPWVPAARVAVYACMRKWTCDPASSGDEPLIVWRECERANDLKCTEAFFWYVAAANYLKEDDRDKGFASRAAVYAESRMHRSKYPPFFRMMTTLLAAKAMSEDKPVSEENHQKIEDYISQSKGMFGQVLADPDLPWTELLGLFQLAERTSFSVYGDRRTLTSDMFDQLKSKTGETSGLLTIQGLFNIDYAWDARGGGWGDSVTPEGWRLFGERIAKAGAALQKAWEIDPSNSIAAAAMITVAMAQSAPRETMELWFSRAMQADPDNYDACQRKMEYLEPKWGGSAEEMLKFGRECVAGGNWDGTIPYVLIEAHVRLSMYEGDQTSWMPIKSYFDKHPEAWPEIRSVFAEYRRHRPFSVKTDLAIIRIASFYGKWDEVNALFDEIGLVWDTQIMPDDERKSLLAAAREHPSTTRPADF